MRFIAVVAAFAGMAAAVPQGVISQISDGQIQAPPATSPVAPGTSVPATAPATTPVVPVAPTTPVAPSIPVITGPPVIVNSTAPVFSPSSKPANSTVASVTLSTTPGVSTPAGSATTPSRPSQTGAAAINVASFGALAVAVAGIVFV